jgi:hypothetical protein
MNFHRYPISSYFGRSAGVDVRRELIVGNLNPITVMLFYALNVPDEIGPKYTRFLVELDCGVNVCFTI